MAAASTAATAMGGGRRIPRSARKTGAISPTYNKEYIKTHEIPKSIITRTIVDVTNIITTTKRNS